MKCFQVWYKNLSLPLYLGFFFSCSILQTWISASLSHSSLINHSLIHPKKKKKNYRFNSTISTIICWASIQGTKNFLFLQPYNFLTNQVNQFDILSFLFRYIVSLLFYNSTKSSDWDLLFTPKQVQKHLAVCEKHKKSNIRLKVTASKIIPIDQYLVKIRIESVHVPAEKTDDSP